LNQLIRDRIWLAENLGVGDIVEGDRDDLTGRFGVSQSDRLEARLTDVNAPNRLIFRHECHPEMQCGYKFFRNGNARDSPSKEVMC
jgi:hypothetical protein